MNWNCSGLNSKLFVLIQYYASSYCTRTHVTSDLSSAHVLYFWHGPRRVNRKVIVVPVQALSQRIPYPRRKTYNLLMRATTTIYEATAVGWLPSLPSFATSFQISLSIFQHVTIPPCPEILCSAPIIIPHLYPHFHLILCFSFSSLSKISPLSLSPLAHQRAFALVKFTLIFSHLYLLLNRFQKSLHVYRPNSCFFKERPKDSIMMLKSPTKTRVTVVTFNVTRLAESDSLPRTEKTPRPPRKPKLLMKTSNQLYSLVTLLSMALWRSCNAILLAIRRKRQTSALVAYVDDQISIFINGQHLRAIIFRDFKSDNELPIATLL